MSQFGKQLAGSNAVHKKGIDAIIAQKGKSNKVTGKILSCTANMASNIKHKTEKPATRKG